MLEAVGVASLAAAAAGVAAAVASAFAAAAVAFPQGSACVQQLHQTSYDDINM